MYFFRILADIGKAFRRVNETILTFQRYPYDAVFTAN